MPADFRQETLAAYAELNARYPHLTVYETYGSLNPGPMQSGRAVSSPRLPKADWPGLREYVEFSHRHAIAFNYTLNASCTGGAEFHPASRSRLLDLIARLVDHGVDHLTMTAPSLLALVKAQFPHLSLCTSTICEIDSVQAARIFVELGADRIILGEDITRDFDVIRSIQRAVSAPIEVLGNSTCLYLCPWKPFHYNLLSHMQAYHQPDIEAYYHWQCMNLRASRPLELLKLRWIRPEDLHLYPDVTFFKIVGRYFAEDSDLVRTARTYMEGRFDGNLWDLLGNFAPQRRHGMVVDNRALDGFVDWFAAHPHGCRTLGCNDCNHCRRYAERAVQADSLRKAYERLGLADLQTRLARFHRHGTLFQNIDETAIFFATEN